MKHSQKRRAIKSAPRRHEYYSASEARENARAGTSKSIALLLPRALSPVLGGKSLKLESGIFRNVSRATRSHFPGHALHEKDFTETNRRRYAGLQPKPRALACPVINRGSIARSVPESVSNRPARRILGFWIRQVLLRITAHRNADLAQNPIRKGQPVRGARNSEIMRATITGA